MPHVERPTSDLPAATPRPARHRLLHALRWILAVVFASATLLYSALWLIDAHRAGRASRVELAFDLEFDPARQQIAVQRVERGGPADRAGIRSGDRIVALDGEPTVDATVQPRIWASRRPGDTLRVSLIRGAHGPRREVLAVFRASSTGSVSDRSGRAGRIAAEALNLYLVPFVIVGLTVLLLRVDAGIVWLLALLLASFAAIPGLRDPYLTLPAGIRPFATAYQPLMISVVGPLFYWLFAVFPQRSVIDRRVPWLKFAGVPLGLSLAATNLLSSGSLVVPTPLSHLLGPDLSRRTPFWFEFGFLALGLASLAWNRARARDTDARRRIRVVFWGTIVGVTPTLLLAAAGELGFRSPIWVSGFMNVIVLALFPLSFAYAILRHRVLDIPVLLRRGARYLLVLRGAIIVLSLASLGLTVLFASLFTRALRPAHDLALPLGIGLGAAFGGILLTAGARVQRRVRVRVDRAFFRSAYDARVVLEDLARRSARTTGRDELARLLEEHLREALQPGSLCVCLRDAGDRLVPASGAQGVRSIDAGAPFLIALASRGQPWEPGGEDSDDRLPPELAELFPECLVPMTGRDGSLLGLLVLGARLSEEPYSREDKRLLASVADQAGIALENIRLAEAIAEKLEAERHAAREMAIARDVQDRLLPQSLPRLASLDLAARCVEARAVGGDFYDALDLGSGRAALALADVSGKGIHAALLMSNLQAHLRGQVGLAPGDPVGCLTRVNTMLWRATDPAHFATLFLGIYEDATRRLAYVNCGHNPPVLLRADGPIEMLGATATVIGAFEDWPCEGRAAQLAPGDLLAIYSDGVTEAMRGDEPFGEERLIAALRRLSACAADQVVAELLREVQEFTSGVAGDDLTVLVGRVR